MNMEECMEAVSPSGEFMSNSVLSLSIIAVLEVEVPLDDSQAMMLLKDVFLPINPRFSSIMVTDNNGVKLWKKVEVNLKDHVNIPSFPPGMSTNFYDNCFDDYLSKIAMSKFSETRPLWEIHLVKYPTSHAAYHIVFKIHHSLGDGFSLMGALLSCLQRADNPSLPLTFPNVQLHTNKDDKNIGMCRRATKIFSVVYNTVSDLCSNIVRSKLVEDDTSPIRSGNFGVELLPVSVATMALSFDHIKQIKAKLGVTVNDVIAGTIYLGSRLYMEAEKKGSGSAESTSLVLLNTRMFRGYKSIHEMLKPHSEMTWGNHFTFLSVPMPKLVNGDPKGPLHFVWKVRKIIKKKRSSFAVLLTAKYLQVLRKIRGPEAVSKYIYGTLKNSSIGITNLIGPLEKMAIAHQPVKGLYFVVAGAPHNMMGVISYMGELRVSMLVEKDFVDPQKLKSHIQDAFDMILKAASATPFKKS